MLKISIDARKKLDVDTKTARLMQDLPAAVSRAADIVAGELREYSLSEVLHGRTGNLAKAWGIQADDPLTFRVVNRMPYAAIHEYGGDIEPKTAKMLAIPVGEALTEKGVPRETGPRKYPDLFLLKSKQGNLLLARRSGDALDVMYVLKDRVSIPARHYASLAIKAARPAAAAQIRKAVQGAIDAGA